VTNESLYNQSTVSGISQNVCAFCSWSFALVQFLISCLVVTSVKLPSVNVDVSTGATA